MAVSCKKEELPVIKPTPVASSDTRPVAVAGNDMTVSLSKWMISKGMKDQDLSGFFSDSDRLLAISTKSSGTLNRDLVSIYEVKF